MKLQWTLLLFGILSSTACKKVVIGSGGGSGGKEKPGDSVEGGSSSADEEVASEEELGEDDEISPDIEASVAEESFNLAKFIASRKEPELDEIKKKLDPELSKIAVGDRNKFGLESNATVLIDTADGAPEGERKLQSRFWIDTYLFSQKVKNIGENSASDNFIEAQGTATLDKLSMEAFYRYLGVDVATKTITAGWEPRYTRDSEMKFGANAIIVGAELSLRMGGEVAVKFEFGVRRDGVLNLIFTPSANITAGVVGAIKVLLGIGSAGPKGITQMMKFTGRGNGNIGYIPKTKMIYADFGMDPGDLVFTDGKVDIVAESIGRTLWTKNVYDPAPLVVKKVPQYGTTIIRYIEKPEDCDAAGAQAKRVLNIGIVKMKKYRDAVAEEDKSVITTSINRMNELKVKAKTCS